MTVGYSLFTNKIKLNGTAKITGQWNVEIIDVKAKEVSSGCSEGNINFSSTKVNFNPKLLKPGDEITYEITIKNSGTIDAVLSFIIFKEDNNGTPLIEFETKEINHELKAGEQSILTVNVMYNQNAEQISESKTKGIIGIIEYVQ